MKKNEDKYFIVGVRHIECSVMHFSNNVLVFLVYFDKN